MKNYETTAADNSPPQVFGRQKEEDDMPDGGQQSGTVSGERMGLRQAREQLQRRRRRGRCLSVAAALVIGGAALLFWSVQGSVLWCALLWAAALAAVLAGRMRSEGAELDEEARRELAVRQERFRRLADWLVGIGVVLMVNGLLILFLMREEGARWALALGMVQAALGCFLCLDMWTTDRAYRRMLRD